MTASDYDPKLFIEILTTDAVSLARPGLFALAGQDLTLTRSLRMTAGHGSFTLSGQAASLDKVYVMAAGHGAFAQSGQAATFTRSLVLPAVHGAFTMAGQAATFTRSLVMPAAHGSFTLSGQAVTLGVVYIMSAGHGAFTMSGQAVTPTRSLVLPAVHGAFTLSGQAVTPTRSLVMTAAYGSFTLTGQAASLDVVSKQALVTAYKDYSNAGSATVSYGDEPTGGDRRFIIVVSVGTFSSAMDTTGVTVSGNAMTQIGDAQGTSGKSTATMWWYELNEGTSGTIDPTWSNSGGRGWAVYTITSGPDGISLGTAYEHESTGDAVFSVDADAGSAIIAVGGCRNANAISFDFLTQDEDDDMASSDYFACGHKDNASALSSQSITGTYTSDGDDGNPTSLVVFNPA